MSNIKPTKAALLLKDCLEEKGIQVVLQHWDGHKHIDIFLPSGNMYIEIDGLQHYLSARQIISDMERDFWSHKNGFKTFRIPHFVALTNYKKVTEAIVNVLDKS